MLSSGGSFSLAEAIGAHENRTPNRADCGPLATRRRSQTRSEKRARSFRAAGRRHRRQHRRVRVQRPGARRPQGRSPRGPRTAARGEAPRARRSPHDHARTPRRGRPSRLHDRRQPARRARLVGRPAACPRAQGAGSLDLDFALSTTGFELDEIDLRIGDAVDRPREPSAGESAAPLDGRRGPPPLPAPTREGGWARDPKGVRKDARLSAGDGSPAPVARAGDAWRLGPHRLLCGGDADAAFFAIDAGIRRWQALACESARLDPTGETFAHAARARRRSTGQDHGGAAE